MASAERIDIEEGQDFVGLEELEAGESPVVELCKLVRFQRCATEIEPLTILQKIHAAIFAFLLFASCLYCTRLRKVMGREVMAG